MIVADCAFDEDGARLALGRDLGKISSMSGVSSEKTVLMVRVILLTAVVGLSDVSFDKGLLR